MVWLALLAALPPSADPCVGSSRSPLFGCYEVTAVPTVSSMKVGSIIAFVPDGAVVQNPDAREWVRLPIAWSDVQPALLVGRDDGGDVSVKQTAPGKVEVVENGGFLATAVRLSAERAAAAAKTFHDLPSLEALRERFRACQAEYVKLLPDEADLGKFDPARFTNTASARSIIQLARLRLARECKPVPAACALSQPTDQELVELKKAEAACRKAR